MMVRVHACALVGAATLAVVVPGCTSASDDTAAAPTTDGPAVVVEAPLPDSIRSRVIGRWRLVEESTADGSQVHTVQGRRLLELSDDGQYHAENYVETRDQSWALLDDTLEFQVERVSVDPETGQIEKRRVTERATILRVDPGELVLIEDVPEIYLRGGPPRKVRNTYRRISDAELGPMLGTRVELSRPAPGRYFGSYQYRLDKLPTMEITISRSISGHAELNLAANGVASGCIGVHESNHFSESKYSSSDGQHHSNRDERHRLLAFRARWAARDEKIGIEIDRFWRDTCREPQGDGDTMGPVELECTALAANDKLPVDALACRVVSGWGPFHELALNPADTERSGPYTMQSDPMGRIAADQGRPWLVLGSGAGLTAHSDDGRREQSPQVRFTSPASELVEARFVAPEPRRP